MYWCDVRWYLSLSWSGDQCALVSPFRDSFISGNLRLSGPDPRSVPRQPFCVSFGFLRPVLRVSTLTSVSPISVPLRWLPSVIRTRSLGRFSRSMGSLGTLHCRIYIIHHLSHSPVPVPSFSFGDDTLCWSSIVPNSYCSTGVNIRTMLVFTFAHLLWSIFHFQVSLIHNK